MAKCIYTPAVRTALENASFNGSIIAKMILDELNADNEMASKAAMNYFDIEIVRSGSSQYFTITACTNDITNPNFPDKSEGAGWKAAYRKEIGVTQFISRFASIRQGVKVDKTIPETEIQFLEDILALPKITINIGSTYNDFEYVYNEANYIPFHSENTLHNSCMRHANVCSKAAQFYANCLKTNILMIMDEDKKVYGRALFWKNIQIGGKKETFVDRVYYTERGIMSMVYHLAASNGWIRKELNTYSDKERFMRFNPESNEWKPFTSACAYWPVEDSESYTGGVGYIDTMTYLTTVKGKLVLRNHYEEDKSYVRCDSTGGYAQICGNFRICPVCGRTYTFSRNGHPICPDCERDAFDMIAGIYVPKHIVTIDGKNYPAEMLDENGKIKEHVSLKTLIYKMTNTNI